MEVCVEWKYHLPSQASHLFTVGQAQVPAKPSQLLLLSTFWAWAWAWIGPWRPQPESASFPTLVEPQSERD